MILSKYAVQKLAPLITGDKLFPYRKGADLVKLFNEVGCRDIYDNRGLPAIDDNYEEEHRPSRTKYVENRMNLLSGKHELRNLLVLVLGEANDPMLMTEEMNKVLNEESFSVAQHNGTFQIEGGIVDKRPPVQNQAYFLHIQNQVLNALDKAQVSITVAMAWFTNDIIRDKLIEKQKEGLEVHVAIFDDGINKKHGVDLSGIPHTLVRASGGGIMHNKFCIIDNQTVLTGSYNWSTNAETRNNENVLISHDPKEATKYTLEFRNLLKQKKQQS